MAGPIVRVKGLRELLVVIDALPKQTRRELRNEIRQVAVPIRDDAQQITTSYLAAHTRTKYDPSKHIRYGISVRKVGTVSVEERIKSKKSRNNKKLKRPRFADLQFEHGLDPAAARNKDKINQALNRVLDSIERRWSS